MGVPAVGPGKLTDVGGPICTYESAPGQDVGTDSVTLSFVRKPPDQLKKLVPSQGTQAVSGVGDEAIYSNGLATLYIRNGKLAFEIGVLSKGGLPASMGLDVQLAADVLAKL